jgi:hypothetical protein
MQHEICLMLKTYRDDLGYATRLLNSFEIYNKERLPLYVVVPSSDYSVFSHLNSSNVVVHTDEDIARKYLVDSMGQDPSALGIINAGVVKLAFWETGFADFYFAIDSDMVFLRDFGRADFIDASGMPFTVLSEYKDLKADPFYRERYWAPRSASYQRVKDLIGLGDLNLEVNTLCSQVISSSVMKSFKSEFLEAKNLSYGACMSIAIYEFFWYAGWVQKKFPQLLSSRSEDLVKVIHHQGEHLRYYLNGFKKADFAAAYLGIIVNSNWSRQYGLVDFDTPPVELYRSVGSWADWISKNAPTVKQD